uniref:Uncharacterized protein n=1 Tax=Rhizophora mucronata TaxID=61149 RepID=A0A2P2QLQ4_RHIMU
MSWRFRHTKLCDQSPTILTAHELWLSLPNVDGDPPIKNAPTVKPVRAARERKRFQRMKAHCLSVGHYCYCCWRLNVK